MKEAMVRTVFSRVSVILTAIFISLVSPGEAAVFQPTTLRISAPILLQYNFDGTTIECPFKLSGTGATVVFSIFTKDMRTSLFGTRNGYLGWHYVNRIDTCIFISQPQLYPSGINVLSWDGRDTDGAVVPSNELTYYIWAYDSINEKQPIARHIDYSRGNAVIAEYDEQGMPQYNPVLYNAPDTYHTGPEPVRITRQKWIIGYDPDDKSLIETTSYTGWIDRNAPVFVPGTYHFFFTSMYTPSGAQVLRQYQWVPNGEALLRTDWGENGEVSMDSWTPPQWFSTPGIALYEDLLFVTVMSESGGASKVGLAMFDIDLGTEIARADMSAWWVDASDTDGDGVRFAGPTTMVSRDGYLALGSHLSCLRQLLNPLLFLDDQEMRVYENGNGDYVGDRNFDETSGRPWVCHDVDAASTSFDLGIDANLFVAFPVSETGPSSFGLLAPDGTGIGYFPAGGDSAGDSRALAILDDNTPYDGIYLDNRDSEGMPGGVWYVAQDSFKGIITSGGDDFGPVHFVYNAVKKTDIKATIIIETLPHDRNGYVYESDDEIGVFSTGGLCVGWSEVKDPNYQTEDTVFSVYGDNPATEVIDGLVFGEALSFRVWDWKTEKEYEAYPLYKSKMTTFRNQAIIVVDSLIVMTEMSVEKHQGTQTISLFQNHPNPFNPATTISFSLPEESHVTLEIYNSLGMKVETLAFSKFSPGIHAIEWDARGFSSGIYFCRIQVGSFVDTKKMLLMK